MNSPYADTPSGIRSVATKNIGVSGYFWQNKNEGLWLWDEHKNQL
jgi:hypothetical protein